MLSFWTASLRGASPAAGREEEVERGERMCGGRRWRQRLKSGEGKTVRALTRMLVVGSSRARGGLNWYLCWEEEIDVLAGCSIEVFCGIGIEV